MRKKKRKQALITFGVITLIIIIAFLFIFFSRMQNATSGQLNTNYQAGKHVQATLSGGYKISGDSEQRLKTEDGKTEIVFNTGDNTIPVNQSFKKVENISLRKGETFLVRYKIKNDNPIYTMVCDLETEISNSSNIVIEYSINNADWYKNSSVIFGANGKSLANNKVMYLYIKISVEVDTINARFDGSFNFVLSTLD